MHYSNFKDKFALLKKQFINYNPIGFPVPEDEYDELVMLLCKKADEGIKSETLYDEIYIYLTRRMGLEDVKLQDIKRNIELF
jgi:hypothetical protein